MWSSLSWLAPRRAPATLNYHRAAMMPGTHTAMAFSPCDVMHASTLLVSRLKAIMDRKQSDDDWLVIFLAADQDAWGGLGGVRRPDFATTSRRRRAVTGAPADG